MLALKCVSVIGLLMAFAHCTFEIKGQLSPVGSMSPSVVDNQLIHRIGSALNLAIVKERRQTDLDRLSFKRGFDEAKGNGRRTFMSARLQHSEVTSYMTTLSNMQSKIAFLITETTLTLTRTPDLRVSDLQRDPAIRRVWQDLVAPHCRPRVPFCPEPTLIYRTIDGSCNNRHNPTWGMANRPQTRYLPPAYDDGINSPRTRGNDGYPLPSPRHVSNMIHSAIVRDLTDDDDSMMVMQFGQMIDHDFVDTPTLRGERNQLNQLSSYIDASFLYGSDKETETRLRSEQGGRLFIRELGFYGEHEDPNLCMTEVPGDYCMKSGDRKIHVTPSLTSLNVMFLRQHNVIAHGLGKLNPHWDDEHLYQTTRKIIIALTQHINYREYLPSILDKGTMVRYGLTGPPLGYDTHYDVTVDATIRNAFAAAAFRFGHSTIPNFIKMLNRHRKLFATNMTETFNRPTLVFTDHGDGYHGLNRWLSVGLGSKTDQFLEDSVRNNLFLDMDGDSFDLAALNIQRGRDHGLLGYNAWRQWLNLPPALSFVAGPGGFVDINPKTVQRLSTLYRHPDDVDLFTGGLAEEPIPGGSVGPTFAGILATQFRDMKVGDRFWYENNFRESGFTEAQLNSVKQFTLSRMACNTVDIKCIQRNIFKIPHEFNEEVPCISIPDIDLTLWRDRGAKHG